MQLVAYGAQDIYLTGNPQITFFKVVYRRHTNFSMESIEQTFNGDSGFGGSATATISRNGDLVHKMWVEHRHSYSDSQTSNDIVSNFGAVFLKEVELEIGGQLIDKHYGHWLACEHELSSFNPTRACGAIPGQGGAFSQTLNSINCVVNSTIEQKASGMGCGVTHPTVDTVNISMNQNILLNMHIFSPLKFWFCKNPGLALPLIALQYHEVKVKITFEDRDILLRKSGTPDSDTGSAAPDNVSGVKNTLWVDYIYLDTDERRRFAQVSHEYLIEQVQYQTTSGTTLAQKNIDLHFNHPVKELVWQVKDTGLMRAHPGRNASSYVAGVSTNITSTDSSGFESVRMGALSQVGIGAKILGGTFGLKLNGHDRFKAQDYRYFTRWQPTQYHSGSGGVVVRDSIAVYSFALKPEEHQPSGTCNFSRIDNAQLSVSNGITILSTIDNVTPEGSGTAITYNIYAVNYNVLRIMSGMGGLAYSN